MNPEKIKIIAGKVIENFVASHCEPGTIGIRDGLILVLAEKDSHTDFHSVKTLSRFAMQQGLTGPEWSVLAENLQELLITEKRCHPHQKPLLPKKS